MKGTDMKTKREMIKIFCCAAVFCLLVCSPVLAEGNSDGQGGQTPDSGQESASGDQSGKTGGQGDSAPGADSGQPGGNAANPGADSGQPGRDAADGLREITGPVALADSEIEDTDPASGNGYTWKSDASGGYVLTLKNVKINGAADANSGGRKWALTVPAGKKVTVKTEGSAVLDGGIHPASTGAGAFNLVFDGAQLKIDGVISNGTEGDRITIQNGADVEITQRPDLGGSNNWDSFIFVTGYGSRLTIGKGEGDDTSGYTSTRVTHLEVTNGGLLTVSSPVGVFEGIVLGEGAMIEIRSTPTFYVESSIDNDHDQAVLNGIVPYLPSGYYLGRGTMSDGTGTYYTVLEPGGAIATSLTLKWPEKEEPTTDAPEKEEPTTAAPEQEEPTTAAPEQGKPDGGGSEEKKQSDHNGSSRPQETEGVQETEAETDTEAETETETETEAAAVADGADDTGSKRLDATPYTGEQNSAGFWLFAVLASAAAFVVQKNLPRKFS